MTSSRNNRPMANLLLGLIVAVLAVATQSAWAETKDDILQTPRRLLSEERKQVDARRRINTVVRRID